MKNDKNKKIKIFSEKVGKTGSQFRDYNIEAQNPVQNFLNKEKTVVINKGLKVNQFKKHIRISLNNFRIDIYRLYKKMYEKEYLTDETVFVDNALYDDYDFLENKVAVMDFKMTVKNDLLYEVLNSLEQRQGGKRGGKNVLNTLAYCLTIETHPDKLHLIAGVSQSTAGINILECDGFGFLNYFEGRYREGKFKDKKCVYVNTLVLYRST